MTTRTLTITLEVPEDLAASVRREAYLAESEVDAYAEQRVSAARLAQRMLLTSTDAPGHNGAINEAITSLNEQMQDIQAAIKYVKLVLNQVAQVLREG